MCVQALEVHLYLSSLFRFICLCIEQESRLSWSIRPWPTLESTQKTVVRHDNAYGPTEAQWHWKLQLSGQLLFSAYHRAPRPNSPHHSYIFNMCKFVQLWARPKVFQIVQLPVPFSAVKSLHNPPLNLFSLSKRTENDHVYTFLPHLHWRLLYCSPLPILSLSSFQHPKWYHLHWRNTKQ